MCGFFDDSPFEETFNLLLNDLYLRWIKFVLAWYKKLSGFLIKFNCDPSNSIEDPLIRGDSFPCGNKFYQSTVPAMHGVCEGRLTWLPNWLKATLCAPNELLCLL